jgi:hypothetical protein
MIVTRTVRSELEVKQMLAKEAVLGHQLEDQINIILTIKLNQLRINPFTVNRPIDQPEIGQLLRIIDRLSPTIGQVLRIIDLSIKIDPLVIKIGPLLLKIGLNILKIDLRIIDLSMLMVVDHSRDHRPDHQHVPQHVPQHALLPDHPQLPPPPLPPPRPPLH